MKLLTLILFLTSFSIFAQNIFDRELNPKLYDEVMADRKAEYSTDFSNSSQNNASNESSNNSSSTPVPLNDDAEATYSKPNLYATTSSYAGDTSSHYWNTEKGCIEMLTAAGETISFHPPEDATCNDDLGMLQYRWTKDGINYDMEFGEFDGCAGLYWTTNENPLGGIIFESYAGNNTYDDISEEVRGYFQLSNN